MIRQSYLFRTAQGLFILVFLLALCSSGWLAFNVIDMVLTQKELDKTRGTIRSLASENFQKKRLEAGNDILQSLNDKLAVPTSANELSVLLREAVKNSGLELDHVQPLTSERDGGFGSSRALVKVTGPYANIASLIQAIETFPRVTTIHNVRLERAGSGLVISEFVVEVTYYE